MLGSLRLDEFVLQGKFSIKGFYLNLQASLNDVIIAAQKNKNSPLRFRKREVVIPKTNRKCLGLSISGGFCNIRQTEIIPVGISKVYNPCRKNTCSKSNILVIGDKIHKVCGREVSQLNHGALVKVIKEFLEKGDVVLEVEYDENLFDEMVKINGVDQCCDENILKQDFKKSAYSKKRDPKNR